MLIGTSSDIKNLTGTISADGSLRGELSVSVIDVPYYETSNEYGGTTVYIGKEVVDRGDK